jgi:hypothetical protein
MTEEQSPEQEPEETVIPEGTAENSEKTEIVEINEVTVGKAWNDFIDTLKGDGTRIISMFKSIKPELGDDNVIKIHLSNAAQKDLFVQNYKQKMIAFLTDKLNLQGIDIESVVDVSENNDILYSDEQKYNYLVTKYPALKELKKTFNLDIH